MRHVSSAPASSSSSSRYDAARGDDSRSARAPLHADLAVVGPSGPPGVIGQFARPSSTTASRASSAAVSCSSVRVGVVVDASSRTSTLPTTPCGGPRPRKFVAVEPLRPQPVRPRVVATAPRRSPCNCVPPSSRAGPLAHRARGEQRAGSAPHQLVRLVVDVLLARAGAGRARDRAFGRAATRRARIPLSPLSRADSGGDGSSSPAMKSGASRNAASVRAAAAEIDLRSPRGRAGAARRAPRMTPAAPTYRFFIGSRRLPAVPLVGRPERVGVERRVDVGDDPADRRAHALLVPRRLRQRLERLRPVEHGGTLSLRGARSPRPLHGARRHPEPVRRGARGRRRRRGATCATARSRSTRTTPARRSASTAGNLYARIEATAPGTPIFLCAHLDTVPPTGRIEPVVDDDGIVRNAAGTILGADDKSAVAVDARGDAARALRTAAARRASSCSSRRRRRSACVGAARVRRVAARREARLRLRPGGADRRGHPRRAVLPVARVTFHGRAVARRDVPGGGPERDRRGRAGDRRPSARPGRRAARPRTSA